MLEIFWYVVVWRYSWKINKSYHLIMDDKIVQRLGSVALHEDESGCIVVEDQDISTDI